MPTTDTTSIIAACDGAERGRQAVVLGRIIAEATGARLTIAAVYPHPGLPFPPLVTDHIDERRRADPRSAPFVTSSLPGQGPSSSRPCPLLTGSASWPTRRGRA